MGKKKNCMQNSDHSADKVRLEANWGEGVGGGGDLEKRKREKKSWRVKRKTGRL